MDHSQDRRKFLLSTLSAAAYATPFAGFLLNSCKTVGGTKNSASLSAEVGDAKVAPSRRLSALDSTNQKNIDLYSKAVAKMKLTPFPILVDGQQLTWWEAHAEIHNTSCPHGNWFFLPWHRGYLYYFEKVVREFCDDPTFSLPFWDWSYFSSLPNRFTSGTEATNPLYNDTRAIKGSNGLGVTQTTLANVEAITDISDFSTFAGGASDHPRALLATDSRGFTGRLEGGPHNKVHATIQGDMGAFTSPRDPIFWLHHCNVDRLWSVWVSKRAEKGQDVLPSDPAADSADARLTREYWLSSKIGGYYSITRVGDTFQAAPAELTVRDVVDAGKMGLSYAYIPRPPVATEPVPPVAPPVAAAGTPEAAAIAAAAPAVPTSTSSAATPVITPTPAAASPSNVKFKVAVKKVIILQTKFSKKLALAGNAPVKINIASSAALESALESAAQYRGNREATLRLVVKNIPFPSNPSGELHFYLNSSTASGEEGNAEYIGAVSFFGHNHSGAVADMAFDLVPTVKRLVTAGKTPYGSAQPLVVSVVWKSNPAADDLSGLVLSLDYLELG